MMSEAESSSASHESESSQSPSREVIERISQDTSDDYDDVDDAAPTSPTERIPAPPAQSPEQVLQIPVVVDEQPGERIPVVGPLPPDAPDAPGPPYICCETGSGPGVVNSHLRRASWTGPFSALQGQSIFSILERLPPRLIPF